MTLRSHCCDCQSVQQLTGEGEGQSKALGDQNPILILLSKTPSILSLTFHVHVEHKRTLVRAFLGNWPITELDLHLEHFYNTLLSHVYVQLKLPIPRAYHKLITIALMFPVSAGRAVADRRLRHVPELGEPRALLQDVPAPRHVRVHVQRHHHDVPRRAPGLLHLHRRLRTHLLRPPPEPGSLFGSL